MKRFVPGVVTAIVVLTAVIALSVAISGPHAAAQDAPTPLTGVVTSQALNVRNGPGADYDAVGMVYKDNVLTISGRNDDASWLYMTRDAVAGWVSARHVSVSGDTWSLPVVTSSPGPSGDAPAATSQPPAPADAATPTPAGTPVPRLPTSTPVPPTPLPRQSVFGQELRSGAWTLKLTEVRRATVVYHDDRPTTAAGTFVMPLVEFRNDSSNATRPIYSFDFYLQNDDGVPYMYDTVGLVAFSAGWQFGVGTVWDEIEPGSTLGVAIPFDVPPDEGDVWLRAWQDPDLILYLGDVSQMPASQ